MSISKADIISRFNSIVHAGLTPAAGTATAWRGNVPGSPASDITNHADLGVRAEPAKTVADISPAADKGVMMANSIFNLLHNLAMEYTRVRKAKWYYVNSGVYSEGAWQVTALRPDFALYFPLDSGSQPLPGQAIDLAVISDFLEDLKVEVNERRTHEKFGHQYSATVCHSSCHSSCHGSRGRR